MRRSRPVSADVRISVGNCAYGHIASRVGWGHAYGMWMTFVVPTQMSTHIRSAIVKEAVIAKYATSADENGRKNA